MEIKTKGKCLMCGQKTRIKIGAIISTDKSIGNGLICLNCTKSNLNGVDVHFKNIPKDVMESAKHKAREQGLTVRAVFTRCMELYGKGSE